MPLTAVGLVLLGALIHAGWNIAAKKANGDSRFAFFNAAIMFVVWTPLCIWLGWDVVPTWGALEWGLIALSGFVHWVYFFCLRCPRQGYGYAMSPKWHQYALVWMDHLNG